MRAERRRVIQRTDEWVIPHGPRGTSWDELELVVDQIRAEYRLEHGIADGVPIPDSMVIQVYGEPGELVLALDYEPRVEDL